MSEVLIKAEGVSKKFAKDLKKSLLYGISDVVVSVMGKPLSGKLRSDEFWAVQDVNFEVKRGECLGLIGHNGAGKSTLLKMLNGLINPDKGRIVMRGRVGALIELGAGFNPVLTGRENIYNNGAVLGFTKAEISRKLDEIIDFSELEEFIDMPVQNYSSGMRVRLGYSVAAQMEPDILLLDEVLAVGDMGFTLKCFNHMDKLLRNTALILVSHSMPQIARMATQIMLMEKGRVAFHSKEASEGITKYYQYFKTEISNFQGSGKATLEDIRIKVGDKVFERSDDIVVPYGADMDIEIKIDVLELLNEPRLYLAFYDKEQRNFAEVTNFNEFVTLNAFSGTLVCTAKIPNVNFAQGKYSITVGFSGVVHETREAIFRYQSAIYFVVDSKRHGWAPVQLSPGWTLMPSKAIS